MIDKKNIEKGTSKRSPPSWLLTKTFSKMINMDHHMMKPDDPVMESIKKYAILACKDIYKSEKDYAINLTKIQELIDPPCHYDILPLTNKFNFGAPVDGIRFFFVGDYERC